MDSYGTACPAIGLFSTSPTGATYPRSPIRVLIIMAKSKAAEKGSEKGGAAAKGKAKGKTDSEEKAGKVKGAQSINVRHILVGLSRNAYDDHHVRSCGQADD